MKSLDELEEWLLKNFQRKFESPLYAFLKLDFQNGNFGNFDLIFCRFSKIVGEILIPPGVIFSNANFKMEILKIRCRFCLNFFYDMVVPCFSIWKIFFYLKKHLFPQFFRYQDASSYKYDFRLCVLLILS